MPSFSLARGILSTGAKSYLKPFRTSSSSRVTPNSSQFRTTAKPYSVVPNRPTTHRSVQPTYSPLSFLDNINSTLFHSMTPQALERNGDARKRKASPVVTRERPTKQMKPRSPSVSDGEESLANGPPYPMDMDEEASRLLPLAAATADTAEWQATIEKVVRNVVSIHFCQTCAFDTDSAITSEATGFVVDAERGYILTNRHVVKYTSWKLCEEKYPDWCDR